MRKIIKIISTFLLTILTPFNINAIKIPDLSEKDFLNSMFLRSEFFENWSDTNFFVNPTLKTSKPLKYQENWYLDFLKDSYSTGVVYNKPSDVFLDLYKNWEKYANQYQISGFHNIDKINFLKNLTNFIYTFVQNHNMSDVSQKLTTNVKDLSLVNLDLEKLKISKIISVQENKWQKVYSGKGYKTFLLSNYKGNNKRWLKIWKDSNGWFSAVSDEEVNTVYSDEDAILFVWTGDTLPNFPKFNRENGEITDWNESIKN